MAGHTLLIRAIAAASLVLAGLTGVSSAPSGASDASAGSASVAAAARVSNYPSRPKPTGPPAKVVQLGDSYAAGNGAGAYVERNCWRSSANYGAQVAQSLGAKFLNVACSGARTADLLHPRALGAPESKSATYDIRPVAYLAAQTRWAALARAANLCGLPNQADMYYVQSVVGPVSVSGASVTGTVSCQLWTRAQIDAVNPSTDVVLVTIGGNDVGFSSIVAACILMKSPSGCSGALDQGVATLPAMAAGVSAALTAIHERTQGRAQVYLVGYPFLLNTSTAVVTDPATGRSYDIGAAMEAFQLGAHVRYVDVKPAWDGHAHGLDIVAPEDNSDSWIIPVFGTANPSEWVHPAPAGWRATATATKTAVRWDAMLTAAP